MSQNISGYDASSQLERFHSSYSVSQDTGCWEWKLALSLDGYGRCYFDGVSVRAHRLSYQIHYGEFPRHFLVLHKCDNARCVNPAHLELGDQKENMKHKKERNRAKGINRGSNNGSSKLSSKDVEDILSLIGSGLKQHQVAKMYGITQGHVSRIKSGERWLK